MVPVAAPPICGCREQTVCKQRKCWRYNKTLFIDRKSGMSFCIHIALSILLSIVLFISKISSVKKSFIAHSHFQQPGRLYFADPWFHFIITVNNF